MAIIETVLGFIVMIVILVTIHELGHFYVARLCGVKVLRFCVGIGVPFWSRTDKHGTEWGIAPFPLGGYVKMLGEVGDDNVEITPDLENQTLESKPLWQRISIMLAGPLANILLAIFVFAGLNMYGVWEYTPIIGEVEPESEAAYAGLEPGQLIVSVDGVDTPNRQAVLERMLLRLGETGEMSMTVTYPGDSELRYNVNLVLEDWLKGAEEPNPIEGIGIYFIRPKILTVVGGVLNDTPAERAGLKVGDKFLSIDGEAVKDWDQWVDYVRMRPGKEIELEIERDGQVELVALVPKPVKLEDGSTIGRVGIYPQRGPWPDNARFRKRYDFGPAMVNAVEKSWSTSVTILVSLKKLFVGEISVKNLSGPIGIAKVAGDSARAGLEYFVQFLAVISVYLGVFNLLPIPILDGGHIMYYIIEGIKGSPVSEKAKWLGFQAGLVAIVFVMVLAFYNDILRL